MIELAKCVGPTGRKDAEIIANTTRWAYDKKERATIKARAKSMFNAANGCESQRSLTASLKLAETMSEIALPVEQLDADPWLLNARNGTIDLRTGALRPHARADMITMMMPVDYVPGARSPLFDAFIEQTTGRDKELERYIQRAAGYSITGDPREEVLFLVHGPGGSGKSTFIEAIRAALGGYAKTADFETFLKKWGDGGIRNDIAGFRGARLVSSIEVDEGKELAAGLVKTITGGDTISARYLYAEFFEFKLTFALWLVANDAPGIDATDSGLQRRMKVVPFPYAIPKEDRNPLLKQFLTDPDLAGPAVLAWLVEGCLAYQSEGLGTCGAVENASADYLESMDDIGRCIDEQFDVDPGAWTATDRLYERYRSWATSSGELPLLTQKALAVRLRKKGYEAKKSGGQRGWSGLRLKDRSNWGEVIEVSDASNLPALPSSERS